MIANKSVEVSEDVYRNKMILNEFQLYLSIKKFMKNDYLF